MAQQKQQAERLDEKEMKNTNGGMNMGTTPHQDIAGSGYQESDEQWRFGDAFQDGNAGMGGTAGSGMSGSNDAGMGSSSGSIR